MKEETTKKNNVFVYDTLTGKTVERYHSEKPQYKAMQLAKGYCEGKEKPTLVNITKAGHKHRYAYETNTDYAVIFYPDL